MSVLTTSSNFVPQIVSVNQTETPLTITMAWQRYFFQIQGMHGESHT